MQPLSRNQPIRKPKYRSYEAKRHPLPGAWPSACASTCEEKLLLAARSRLNRMMKPHKKKKGLEAPESARRYWEEGNKQEMTLLLRDCNFCKDISGLLHSFKCISDLLIQH